MSLLTPLYLAGLAAVSLPIVFHLIRRTPERRQAFSSLMFLAPSPPTITRRSRLNHLLLLLLRAGALALLALAFARPLFQWPGDVDESIAPGRRVALLVDVSASMRRGDLWEQAKRRAEQAAADLTAQDVLSLYAFDESVRSLITSSQWRLLEPSERLALVRTELGGMQPGWGSTRLGDALLAAADALADDDPAQDSQVGTRRQIILISDVQQGSRLESLEGYEWPEGVLLECRPVSPSATTNAALALAANESSESDESGEGESIRVRVTNASDSASEQFSIVWGNQVGPAGAGAATRVSVPPGSSRIVRIAKPGSQVEADRVMLSGDDHEFDNRLFLLPPRAKMVRVVYLGDDGPNEPQGLAYYLRHALSSVPRRSVDFAMLGPADLLDDETLRSAALVVLTGPVAESNVGALRNYLNSGGVVLAVLSDATTAESVRPLAPSALGDVAEGSDAGYALLGAIAFDHPLFQRFANPRFADFTKIRFWRHRRVTLLDAEPVSPSSPVVLADGAPTSSDRPRVIAAFDNSDPCLWQQQLGRGTLYVLASSWRPTDSQLALSTKFVPLIDGFIPAASDGLSRSQFTVGDSPPIPAQDAPGRLERPAPGAGAPGATATVDADLRLDEPGIWRLAADGREYPLAVNLADEESRTAPMPLEELERRGVRLGAQPTNTELLAARRQLKTFELENQQKLWQWVIAGVLSLLAAETVLAGLLTRRAVAASATSHYG